MRDATETLSKRELLVNAVGRIIEASFIAFLAVVTIVVLEKQPFIELTILGFLAWIELVLFDLI